MSAPSATTPTGDCDHPNNDRDSHKRKRREGETKDEQSERKRAKKVRKEEQRQQQEAEEAEREQEEAACRKKTERQRREFKELEQVAAETAVRMRELQKELGESDEEENMEGESDKEEEVGVVLDDGNECDYCRKHAQQCVVVSGARACTTCKLKKTKCSLLPVTRVNRRVEARNRKTSGKPGSKGDDKDDCGNNDNNSDNAGHDKPPCRVTQSATQRAQSDRPGPSTQQAPQTRDDTLLRHVGELWTWVEQHERALWSLIEHQRQVYFRMGEMLEVLWGVMEVIDWFTEDGLPPAAYQRARGSEEEHLACEEYEREDWVEYTDNEEEGPAPTGVIVDNGWHPEDDEEDEEMAPP
ncbi:hypothetical protein C8J57DRAFT_1518107 [Mycena rebaudengoi]|nr:hypothetical protein C8J57DRAFT_1518107 [Mycena rebaudengoi]